MTSISAKKFTLNLWLFSTVWAMHYLVRISSTTTAFLCLRNSFKKSNLSSFFFAVLWASGVYFKVPIRSFFSSYKNATKVRDEWEKICILKSYNFKSTLREIHSYFSPFLFTQKAIFSTIWLAVAYLKINRFPRFYFDYYMVQLQLPTISLRKLYFKNQSSLRSRLQRNAILKRFPTFPSWLLLVKAAIFT